MNSILRSIREIPKWVFTLFGIFVILSLFLHQDIGSFFGARWDAEHYLSIADRGYFLNTCPEEAQARGVKICGNIWFPGFSYIVRLFSALTFYRISTPVLAVWLSCLLTFLAVIVGIAVLSKNARRTKLSDHVSQGIESSGTLLAGHSIDSESKSGTILAVLFLISQPTGFYLLTAFPYGFMLFTSLIFIFTYKQHFLISAIFGFLVSLAYPSGFLFFLFPLTAFLIDFSQKKRSQTGLAQKIGRLFLYGFCFVAGTLFVSILFKFQFDDFLLYFRHQAQYGRTSKNPFEVIASTIGSVHFENIGGQYILRGFYDEAFVFIWYAYAIFLIATSQSIRNAKGSFREMGPWVVTAVGLYLFAPFLGSHQSMYRYYVSISFLFFLIVHEKRMTIGHILLIGTGFIVEFAYFLPKYLSGGLI